MSQKIFLSCLLSVFVLAPAAVSFERTSNYTSTLTVNDFAFAGDTVWAATSGGLYCYNRAARTGTLYSNPSFFPDPSIAAVCLDKGRNLWAGSANGFLTKRPANGRPTVVTSYHTSGWKISDLEIYGKYLIVASDMGCSIFDTDKMVAINNATYFNSIFQKPGVNTVAIFSGTNGRDTLLLGCYRGVAKLDITGNNLRDAIFYNPQIWTIDTSSGQQVRSFAISANGYAGLPHIGTRFGSQTVTAINDTVNEIAQTVVYADSVEKIRLPSTAAAIAADKAGTCCIGTTYHCFYLWNGSDTVNVKIDGPTFLKTFRVYVDSKSEVWVCPEMSKGDGNTPWEGIGRYHNGGWSLYNALVPQMGQLGGGNHYFLAVCEDPLGRMWFGTDGGQAKRFNRQDGTWLQYCVGALNLGGGKFFQGQICSNENGWAKCDAIARDSTGFLWFGIFTSYPGSLLCYDPRYEPDPNAADPSARHFRYFFPKETDQYYSPLIGGLCVDAANNLIAMDGSGANGRILVVSHNGNPLGDGVRIKADFNDRRGIFLDAATTRDTLTYLATTTGFYTYNPFSNSIHSGLGARTWTDGKPKFSVIDTTLREISAVEVEDERFIWLGTANSGLIRYDLTTSSGTVVDETAGLMSNSITDLSIDRKNGQLWIASDRGVSRYALGYALDRKNTDMLSVYPNPYSKRRHREVVFEKLPPGSSVQVFTVGGSLVTSLLPVESSGTGAACVWKPPKAIVPGVYLYTVRSRSNSSQGKIIVAP